MITRQDFDNLLEAFGHYAAVVRSKFKRRTPKGIDPARVLPGRVYVFDRLPGCPGRLDGVACDRVEAVEEGVVLLARGGWCDLGVFAAMVLDGPFDPEKGRVAG